jgi:folate-binding protein YgfZ
MSELLAAHLESRAALVVAGETWPDFLQGLVTQDVMNLRPGEVRFGALLTPQGRLLHDLFFHGREAGCLIDCAADQRAALISRLTMYRLRAKVAIEASDQPVFALWGADTVPAGWSRDPRLDTLGWRAIGETPPPAARLVGESAHEAHRLAQGAPGAADLGSDRTYPIEADFDLLNGIDFRKGCFIGQETTSRMKRRGQIRNRMLPIAVEGPLPTPGTELLAGTLRAGEALSGLGERAMALLRLDRLGAGPLTFGDGRPWRPVWPAWMAPEVQV